MFWSDFTIVFLVFGISSPFNHLPHLSFPFLLGLTYHPSQSSKPSHLISTSIGPLLNIHDNDEGDHRLDPFSSLSSVISIPSHYSRMKQSEWGLTHKQPRRKFWFPDMKRPDMTRRPARPTWSFHLILRPTGCQLCLLHLHWFPVDIYLSSCCTSPVSSRLQMALNIRSTDWPYWDMSKHVTNPILESCRFL